MGYAEDEAQAQDFLQETFIRIWQNLSKFRGEASISTWIYRITVNTCLGHLRSPKNKVPAELKPNFDTADDTANISKDHHLQQLYRAIRKLPETERLIISMVLEEIPYEEIASSFNITEGNLRVKIHRIKLELTQLFFLHE